MRVSNHGKYTKMKLRDPKAIATCDYSGLMVQHAAMRDQMVYRGQGLVKTGYRVNPKFYDKPNAQDLTPRIFPDPIPVLNPRPDSQIDAFQPEILVLDVSSGDVTLTLEQFANTTQIFTGTLTQNVIISVPATFNTFYVENRTTGAFTLTMQIISSFQTAIELVRDKKLWIANDSMSLKFINT